MKTIFSKLSRNNNQISSLITYKNDAIDSKSTQISKRGYRGNVVAYRCIRLIASSIAQVKWIEKVYNSDGTVKMIKKSEILDLIINPNESQSRSEFMECAASHLLLSGNCFIECIRDSNGKICEMFVLRPDRVRVIPGPNSLPLGYEYNVDGEKKITLIDQETGSCDILHIKTFNPSDDWYGLSPMEVVNGPVEQHNAILNQNLSFLQNGGRPSGALIYKSNGDMLDSEKRAKLREDLKCAYEGTKNAGRIILLEGEFEWKEIGLSPKDLDFISGKELAAKEIALAFGIPPILIGSTSDATFANYKEAKYNFWEETIIPYLDLISNNLSNWFTRLMGKRIEIKYDLDSIQALSKRRESEWRKLQNADFLTEDEKREKVGLPKRSESIEEKNS